MRGGVGPSLARRISPLAGKTHLSTPEKHLLNVENVLWNSHLDPILSSLPAVPVHSLTDRKTVDRLRARYPVFPGKFPLKPGCTAKIDSISIIFQTLMARPAVSETGKENR
jgi:hypothetical protein